MAAAAGEQIAALTLELGKHVDGPVTVANLTLLIGTAMKAAEKLSGLSGPDKKELVLISLGRFVSEFADEQQAPAIRAAFDLLAPGMIDLLVSAAKGQLGLSVRRRFKAKCC